MCPYRGFASFRKEDAQWFFGRERELAELLTRLEERMHTGGAVAVAGPAGSGKSSLLAAGLLPEIASGALPGADGWAVVSLVPGTHPLTALAGGLARLTGAEAVELAGALARDPEVGAARVRDAVGPEAGGNRRCLVVVDQLEELFSPVSDREEGHTFVHALSALAEPGRNGQPPAALVVFGMSTAYMGRWAEFPQVSTALRDAVLLGPLTETGMREVIARPAQAVGLDIEPGLVELLLSDLLGGSPDARLQLLQAALLSTWARRRGRSLTVEAYRATGGITGVLAVSAEQAFAGLRLEEQEAARLLFLRLIRVGEDIQPTRRRVARDVLVPAGSTEATAVVDKFIRQRILTQDGEWLEIAHEALLFCWPRLRAWLDADPAGNRLRQEVEDAAVAWMRDDRDPQALYRGQRLAQSLSWAAGVPEPYDLSVLAVEFLRVSATRAGPHTAWLRRGLVAGLIAVVAAGFTAALVLLLGLLPAFHGWWSVGGFFMLWALVAAAVLLTARRTSSARREPSRLQPPARTGGDAVSRRTRDFVSGLLDVWQLSNAHSGPGRRTSLLRGEAPPSRDRALLNVEAALDGACARLGRLPERSAHGPGDQSNGVERCD